MCREADSSHLAGRGHRGRWLGGPGAHKTFSWTPPLAPLLRKAVISTLCPCGREQYEPANILEPQLETPQGAAQGQPVSG